MAAGAVVLLAATGVTDYLREDWRRMTGHAGQACFDHERQSLADPAGARFDTYSVSASDASEVTITYRTGNGAGTDAVAEAVCVLRDGEVAEADTVRRREHAMAAKRFDSLIAEFDCLERQKGILRAGKVDEAGRAQCSR